MLITFLYLQLSGHEIKSQNTSNNISWHCRYGNNRISLDVFIIYVMIIILRQLAVARYMYFGYLSSNYSQQTCKIMLLLSCHINSVDLFFIVFFLIC